MSLLAKWMEDYLGINSTLVFWRHGVSCLGQIENRKGRDV